MTDLPAPFDRYRDRVRPEWIDGNGHMNVGYYLVVFDYATDEFLAWVGLDERHRREHRVTTFCLEAHVTYHREVRSGDPLRFTTLLLGHDAKRIHYFHTMYHATAGYLAATNELMSLHVSEATRRGGPMAPGILERLARIQKAHDGLPRPPQVGRTIGLASSSTTPRREGGG
jgi:acyl-CoA thioester hydrolase